MNFEKVDPALLRIWRDRHERWRLERHVTRWGVVLPDEGPALVHVILRGALGAELASVAARLGARISTGDFGGARHAVVRLDSVEELSETDAVSHIALAPKRHPKLGDAARAVRLPEFRSATGATGRGVLIGIIDTGIDISHPALQGRVLAVWDQKAVPGDVDAANPHGLLVGQRLAHSADDDGHGTHVASIAAGNGCVAGVAPGAELVVVKCDGTDTNIMEGVRFVLTHAGSRPVVINLSWGAHCDPHDGTDELSGFLDQVSGPGRIVCCAAGNEGDLQIHARVPAARSRRETVRCVEFVVPRQEEGFSSRSIIFHGWYAPTEAIAVAVEFPRGRRSSFVEPPAPHGAPDARDVIEGVEVNTTVVRVRGGISYFSVELTPDSPGPFAPGSDPLVGTWKLLLRTRNLMPIDIWVEDGVDDDDAASPTEFEGKFVRNSMRIGSPGAAKRAITVANLTTKNAWTTHAGERVVDRDLTVGRIAPDSSDGPLRDGTNKPDVSAPGSMIVAARSTQSEDDLHLDVSATHRIMGGTSMATPFVAGIVALMLENQPYLTPERIKTLLSAGARPVRQAARAKAGCGVVRLHDGARGQARAETRRAGKSLKSRTRSASG